MPFTLLLSPPPPSQLIPPLEDVLKTETCLQYVSCKINVRTTDPYPSVKYLFTDIVCVLCSHTVEKNQRNEVTFLEATLLAVAAGMVIGADEQ